MSSGNYPTEIIPYRYDPTANPNPIASTVGTITVATNNVGAVTTVTIDDSISSTGTIFIPYTQPFTMETDAQHTEEQRSLRSMEYIVLLNEMKQQVIRHSKVFSLNFDYNRPSAREAVAKRLGGRIFNLLHELKPILDEVYPDRWNYQFGLSLKTKVQINEYGDNSVRDINVPDKIVINHVYIVIWFPEIKIANKDKESMLLKDVFVRLPLAINSSNNSIHFDTIEGTRTTLSLEEFESNYLHSHLTSFSNSQVCNYTAFCVGNGDISMTTGLLNEDLRKVTVKPELFKAHLFNIQAYLEWESIETRPYMRMNNTISMSYDYPKVSLGDCESVFRKFRKHIHTWKKELDLDWAFNGRYYIVDNDKFEEALRIAYDIYGYGKVFLYRDAAGKYFTETVTSRNPKMFENNWLPFRREKRYFKVEGEVKKATSREVVMHPVVKNYIKSKLELYANYNEIRKAGIRSLDTYPNT